MNKNIAQQLVDLGLADKKPKPSLMICPKCDSRKVYEISNLHMIWGCLGCGFQGDGMDFDRNQRSC